MEVWAKKLSDDRYGVLFINRDDTHSGKVSLEWENLNLIGEKTLRDVFAGKEIGKFEKVFSERIAPHTGLFFTIN